VNLHDGSDRSRSGNGRKRNSSDPSDSDSVELPSPLTIVLFDLHWIVMLLALPIPTPLPIPSLVQGPKLTFFSCQMEKCGHQKVLVKLFLGSETQAKIIGHHRLSGKIFAINVIRSQKVLKSSFDHFDRSTLPPFDAQRISKSSSNFFMDIVSTL